MKASLWTLILFIGGTVVTSWLLRDNRQALTTIYWSESKAGLQTNPRMQRIKCSALKPGAEETIAQMRDEFLRLQIEAGAAQSDRVRELKRILDAVDALKEIEQDLNNCEAQRSSDDASMREKAKAFYGEFTSIKDELETQLNKML